MDMITPEVSSIELLFVPFCLVTDYRSASQGNNPNLYPGERPEGSYVTDDEHVFDVTVAAEAGSLQFQIGEEGGDVYRLPSQELPKDQWANKAAREKTLRGVGTRTLRSSGGTLVELK